MTLSNAKRARRPAPFVWRLRAPVDLTTADGRASERQRRIALTGLASALAKALSVGSALVTVPMTLRYLGPERYGLWMTITSFVAMMGFADLGVGNGLMTAVASANGREDTAQIRAYVSSAYVALAAIALGIVALFGLSSVFVDWPGVFNVHSAEARQEAAPALAALVVCFAVAMPAGVAQKTQMGLQSGFVASLWQCAASLLGLLGLWAAVHWRAPLPVLVLSLGGAPVLAAALNGAAFFSRVRPDIAPSRRWASLPAARAVLGTGLLFLALQLAGAIGLASDNLIIAHQLGAGAVAGYAVPAQMFNLIGTVVAMLSAPLWPAYSEAKARGDWAWVQRTFGRSLGFSTGAATFASACLVAGGPTILGLWVGHSVSPTWSLLIGLGVWKVVEAIGNAVAMLLNGLQIVRTQVFLASLACGVAVVLKVVLVAHVGVSGVVWGAIVAYIVFALAPYAFLLNNYLSR